MTKNNGVHQPAVKAPYNELKQKEGFIIYVCICHDEVKFL